MTFLATDKMQPIYGLVEKATEQFFYTPKLSYQDVLAARDMIILIGDKPRWDLLQTDMPTAAMYFPVAPGTSLPQIRKAQELGYPLVAVSDNVYARSENRPIYEILTGRNSMDQTYHQHIVGEDEWREWWPELGSEPIENTYKIAEKCRAKLLSAELVEPERPLPLLDMCIAGAKAKDIPIDLPEYRERLDYELGLIAEKNYEDYFYIIADLCQYAKQHMFVGPARGSSCGSLVCYCLDITEVDPLQHGLIFERFIDLNRADLPDIDIDFSDRRRPKVEKYMRDKYGSDKVARLGTVSMYKPKSAINETSAALDVPKWEVTEFSDSILERSSGDARAQQAVEDTFNETEVGRALLEKYPEMMMCAQLEGHPRHSGQHAAGVVVTREPLINYASLDHKTGSLMIDKVDAEELNILKIDCLGLTQLSIFEEVLESVGKEREWLRDYPLDDVEAFKILNDRKFTGIFQFQGFALQSLCHQIEVSEFNDIVSITALARPGPLHSGGATEWTQRRSGIHPVVYEHELMKPILEDTYGVTIYQEQIMRIAREVGGLSWEDVSSLRKAMSKSLGVEFFNQYKEQFIPGAVERGMPAMVADKIWEEMCHYGSWSFNKSHAVAYGLISYWCCVLKSKYPLEFAAASLNRESDTDKQIKLLRELDHEDIGYIPVDVESSTTQWEVGDGKLIGPLTGIHGVGPRTAQQMVKLRREGSEATGRIKTLLSNPVTPYDHLYPLHEHFPEVFGPVGNHHPLNLAEPLTEIEVITAEDDGEYYVIGEVKEINLRDHNETGSVAKRGYEMTGPTKFLNLVIQDDSSSIIAQFSRFKYQKFGATIVERGVGHVWLFKGNCRKGFRRLYMEKARYVGKV
jgi:DNA-directed DNA polymerase III PolC